MTIQNTVKVAIIGSGTMASGIMQVLALTDHVERVSLIARTEEKASQCINKCFSKIDSLLAKGKITESQKKSAESSVYSGTLESVRNADIVIEAVAENFEIKKAIFEDISNVVTPNTIVASNTSSISITALASILDNPENVIGLHFFNPAPLMELVEVVPGYLTCEETLTKALAFIDSIGKSAVRVSDSPGFIVNRMLIPMINEAVCILSEGNASVDSIDKAMKLGAHHPMGPLALSDLIGNDVTLSIMDTLFEETGDGKYRANPLLRKMVRAGHLGRKVKEGFYKY
ncbi:MAG: 3-hydroxybutyryl-CoA dehydrogenase [Idiomarina sp. T82-3]|uniref:3-hydroxyacyl-CoA dehydrogenase family protein n=1 Tax=Idiomarina TaxID=135575 RepID=UPI000792E167|nr:3-hydroxyacyl-CoA dehydrogenase NAD-binding domain-containing protein [Idiomarina sp. T82-3]KXS35316.1 MAG: 3-hydroxybutyryl-CoA dehydrogenase [Idiomarina sp. T82-3]